MAAYLAYKVLRGDFTYWAPLESKTFSLVASLLLRSLRKILADVTGLLQERHPLEMGGAYFSLNTIWSQVFPYVALKIYASHWREEDGDDDSTSSTRLTESELLTLLVALTAVWAASTVTFVASINRAYLQSFLTTETASQYTIRQFRDAKNDEARFDTVFNNHASYTASIKAEVKTWLDESFPTWQREHPPWLTDAFIANIPDDMLPKEVLQELNMKGGGKRRRSSIGDRLSEVG